MLNRWQKTVVDRQGNIASWAALIIRKEADQMPATVYRDSEGTDPYPTGQVTADGNGFAYFYAAPGLYRITGQTPVIDWRDVGIGAAADLIESRHDATPGRVVTTGGFGMGVPGDGALEALDVDLDTVLVSGDYYCADTCTNLPGDLPGFLSVSAGSDPDRKLQRFVEDSEGGKEYRRIVDGTPGVEWQESGGGAGDAIEWLGTPIGGYITPFSPPPTNDPRFRYVLCTAGQTGSGKYNNGILTDETVTGSAPLIEATAKVSLAGSPFDGLTIHLINTEGRFVGAGAAEAFEDDAFQGFRIGYSTGQYVGHWRVQANSGSGVDPESLRTNTGASLIPISDGVNGTPRTGDHTQPRAHRLPHYRRIL
jgi:hypothetical protein